MNRYTLLSLILLLTGCSRPVRYEVVIRNASLFDGERHRGIVSIAINKDTIAAISQENIKGASVIDAAGGFIIPGLVNAHVHASKAAHLRLGYRLGILTLLNMHTGLETREQKWRKLSRDSAGYSTLYGAGFAATVPRGHPTPFSPEMETINDSVTIEQWVDHRIENGADYIKIVRENHPWLDHPAQPTLSYQQIKHIIDYAHSKGLKVVVHASQARDFVEISKLKPDGFVHLWDFKSNSDISDEDYKTIASSGAFVVPTAGISLRPSKAPPVIRSWIGRNMLSLEERVRVIKKFDSLGVTIVCGTDAQEGQMNFEEDYYYELQMYKMAGLSDEEVLKAATGNAAKAFNLPVGVLRVGSKADFVILDDDPRADIQNIKKIRQVWKNGTYLTRLPTP